MKGIVALLCTPGAAVATLASRLAAAPYQGKHYYDTSTNFSFQLGSGAIRLTVMNFPLWPPYVRARLP